MSDKLPPCDHDECGKMNCDKPRFQPASVIYKLFCPVCGTSDPFIKQRHLSEP